MASSSDSDCQNSLVQQRKKRKRLSRKKRLKLQADRTPMQTVTAKISKLTKQPFSPKPTKKDTKTKENSKRENKKDKNKFDFSNLKTKTKSKSKNTSENGKSPKKGFQKVKAILAKKPDTMDQHSKQIEKLQQKLNAAKFRYLNEKLYTESGDKSFSYFQSDPQAFKIYHEGFQDQVKKWPMNPLDKIIAYVRQNPRTAKIVDFGCGEALLAQSVPHEVASFDLVALNKHVTACNMSRVPLKIASMDIAVFCLSLMGTNMVDYLIEAGRVLKNKGTLLIAEVVSRFEDSLSFIQKVEKLGFCHLSTSNFKMFVIMKFIRDSSKSKIKKSNITLSLKPCVYKKRWSVMFIFFLLIAHQRITDAFCLRSLLMLNYKIQHE